MSETSSLRVRLHDGARQLLDGTSEVFIRILDGTQKQHVAGWFKQPDLTFANLPFYNNFGDNHIVLASKKGCHNAGFSPVKLSPTFVETLDLMLIPKPCRFNFDRARWALLRQTSPSFCSILSGVAPDAGTHFDALLKDDPTDDYLKARQAADVLNLFTAMRDIHLPVGTPLDYLKGVIWEGAHGLQPDRLFAWADPELVNQVKRAAAQGAFDQEFNPKFFHPGATSSYKENRFGEANVQLTFHEDDRLEVGGVNCIIVEPDIDYYRDLGAHGILEVLPGLFPSGMTDPRVVYFLRWIAGRRHAGIREFDPPYSLEPVTA